MTVAVVTSFSPSGYDLYGKRMLDTFEKFWPRDVKLYVYYEGEVPPADASGRAIWLSLDADEDRAAFMAAFEDHPKDYNLQPVKFSHKVFAVTSAPRDTDWLIWLDGDVETCAHITHRFLNSLYPDDIVAAYMGRSWWNHTETGFVAYRMNDDGKRFLDDLRLMYTTGEITEVEDYRGKKQQHDCAAFDLVREAYETLGHQFYDMGEGHRGPDLDVMAYTPLHSVMYHYKGNRKRVHISRRYDQLVKLVQHCKPRTIVEVGTHNGKRAERMSREALKHNPNVHYTGFDLFDEADEQTSAEEMNGKGGADFEAAMLRLNDVKESNPGFTFELHKGNTRKTLHGKTITADFAFIDGGHSIETIKGDYEALQSTKLIALDDWYTKGVDTKKYGCNEVIKKRTYSVLPWEDKFGQGGRVRIAVVGDYPHKKTLNPEQMKRRVLTKEWTDLFDQQRELLARYGDPTVSAQTFEMWENDAEDKPADILFVVNILEYLSDTAEALEKIRKLAKMGVLFSIECDPMRDLETWKDIIGQYFRITDSHEDKTNGRITISSDCNVLVPGVKPIAAGTNTGRWENIKASCERFKSYVPQVKPHERQAILACYGPSLKDYLVRLKEEAPDCDVVSVSGSHDYLIENGIIPRYHVECDPRPHKAAQVTPQKGITYLLAASCHPDLFAKMDGMDVRLWHCEEHIRVRDELNNQAPNIAGGGSVGLRSIGALYFMGYRNITIYGMDCSFEDEGKTQHAGKHAGKIQETCITTIEDRHFVTSPVLMTYAANFFDMVKQRPDVKWRIYGDGLLQNWVRYATKLSQTEAA